MVAITRLANILLAVPLERTAGVSGIGKQVSRIGALPTGMEMAAPVVSRLTGIVKKWQLRKS